MYLAQVILCDMGDSDSTFQLDDPRVMRALAHPLRLKLLGQLRAEGPATATVLCDRLDEAPGLVSYHLHQLAKHGFIEEAPELARDGRERWWRAAHERTSWSNADFLDDPERWAAATALQREQLRRYDERLQTFLDEQSAWGEDWNRAATNSDWLLRLSPGQLRDLLGELEQVIARYEQLEPDDGSETVGLILHAFPLRRPSQG